MIDFVTGGSGFIGQRLVAALKQSGGEIRVLSREEKSVIGLPIFPILLYLLLCFYLPNP